MYNNVYQEYINNIIGPMPKRQLDFEYNSFRNSNSFQNQNATNLELERFYPDLYKLLYPMIQTACIKNTKPITEETIDEMVKDIYNNFYVDEAVMSNLNLVDDIRNSNKTAEVRKSVNSKFVPKTLAGTRNTETKEHTNLKPNNYLLHDLIKILLIKELIRTQGNIMQYRPEFSTQSLEIPLFY